MSVSAEFYGAGNIDDVESVLVGGVIFPACLYISGDLHVCSEIKKPSDYRVFQIEPNNKNVAGHNVSVTVKKKKRNGIVEGVATYAPCRPF